MTWGYHLILDCKDCDPEAINNDVTIRNFVSTLVERIDMQVHGDPQIELLLPGTDNEGYSVLQMITTSNITAHFVNKTGNAYIDLFSCKQFENNIVIHTVEEFFNPESIKSTYIER